MKAGESNKHGGFGVDPKKVENVTREKVSGHGDMTMQATIAAFNAANKDNKKA